MEANLSTLFVVYDERNNHLKHSTALDHSLVIQISNGVK